MTLSTEVGPSWAAQIAGTGMVCAAAVVVGGWFAVFAGHPVVGLLDPFSPLGWRVPIWLGGGLAFVALHDDRVEVGHQFILDVRHAAANATHRDKVRQRVCRFWVGQRGDGIERPVLAGERADRRVAEDPVEVGDGAV